MSVRKREKLRVYNPGEILSVGVSVDACLARPPPGAKLGKNRVYRPGEEVEGLGSWCSRNARIVLWHVLLALSACMQGPERNSVISLG